MDALLDLFDGFFPRQHTADGKEAGLHDGVDPAAHPGFFSHIIGVNDIEMQFLVNNILLDFAGEAVPDLVMRINAVEQEHTAGFGIFQHVQPFQEGELMAGDEIGIMPSDQVGSADRFGSKAQVRDGYGAGFFGVVDRNNPAHNFRFLRR